MTDESTGRVRSGLARAANLSPERRSEIAQNAAKQRWEVGVIKADFIGKLAFGERSIDCAVLPDGTRVLSQRGVGRALGRRTGGEDYRRRTEENGGGVLPVYLSLPVLKPFISNELMVAVNNPIVYRHGKGGGTANGLAATALPQVCNVWLEARSAHYRNEIRLNKAQLEAAQRAEIIIRGLADVGIVALVDEATGYQDAREKDALQDIFNAFLRKELAAWVKRIPDEFYKEIYRLRGWNWTGMKGGRRPQILAYYTVDLVYSRLLPNIMEELENRMPRTEGGKRKGKLHQLFSEDVGHPALSQHLYSTTTLMRVTEDGDWDGFLRMMNKAHPKKTDKWIKALLQGAADLTPEDVSSSASTETLPLFAQLPGVAQGSSSLP